MGLLNRREGNSLLGEGQAYMIFAGKCIQPDTALVIYYSPDFIDHHPSVWHRTCLMQCNVLRMTSLSLVPTLTYSLFCGSGIHSTFILLELDERI